VSAGAPYQPFQITSQATDEQFPEWSHDGTMIAFCADCDADNSEIYHVSPAGGSWTQVTTDGMTNRSPTWSPNDDYIAYSSRRGSEHSVYKIQLSGGLISRVSFENNEEMHPSWSPDGNFIAYMQNSSEIPSKWNVNYISVTGGISTPVTDTNDGINQSFPWWSPDGKRIAYTDWSSPEANIYSVKVR
jgi:TolB protein